MTIHLEWLRTGRAPRGTPRRTGIPRRGVALALLAAMAMTTAGCTSGPFANCGSCNSCGFFKRTTARVLHRPSSGCCGSGSVGDSAVEYGAPSTVVGPGATTVGPMYSPGSSTGSIPSTVPPPDSPTILSPNSEAAPSARPGSPPSTGATSGSGGSRTSYVTRPSATKTAVRLDAGLTPGRASLSRPSSPATGDDAGISAPGEDDNPLDHLPPLALPGEVTQAAGFPFPPAARPEGVSSSAEGVSLMAPDAAEPETPPNAARGIARFAPVDPMLAGGSLPTAEGLAWLAEKGYRTVLDLRPSGEVNPAFIAEVAARGLRYVALPVDLDKLTPDRLARFQFELAAPEARPLFFFDADGARAGALWYVRRVTVDRVDPQMARREAVAIGLKDSSAWQLTTTYLERLEADKVHPGNASAPARTGAAEPPTPPAAAATTDAPAAEPGSLEMPQITMPVATTTSRPDQLPAGSLPSQAIAWRPIAAMLITGLSLPLVYWTRTALPEAIAKARASLPAPAPRPRSLPRESGE